ncbi:single-stranded DNA-binding protein [Escherichia coli]
MANLQVATSESWRDNRRGRCGSRQNGIAWCCSASSRKWQVNICKGAQVYIEGQLRTRSWEDNGITRYVTEILVKTTGTMQMLDVPQVLRLSRKRRNSLKRSASAGTTGGGRYEKRRRKNERPWT